MEIFKKKTHFDFMGKRRLALMLSTGINLLSIAFLIFRGLNFGLDYTGGMLLEIGYEQPVELSEVRKSLAEIGYQEALVQHFGTTREVMIRLAPQEGKNSQKIGDEVLKALKTGNTGNDDRINLRRVEFVGPEMGEELATDGWMAMFYATIGILIYVTFRFEYRFATGAVVALVHDVLVILGIFSMFWLEFDLTVLAAVLAVIGYSLNDTVIIADRIRENFHKLRKATTIEVLNSAINDTLSRTIMTSALTLMVLIVFYFLGGEALHGFSLALIIGIIVGTYSSIYIASPIALVLGVNKTHFLVKSKGITTSKDNLL
ncbi:preprotein translocase subunit SecF [Candidatus Nitrosoglobus terrae]|uniref:Protein-export membrane protein SecF n=1 Tax=Candidatus Nitrosoglobus terrae TaxID=1630141 RepID=A0A1Q2SK41_9GAMM|nr:protein translocase subunit SecF [Candidatus Nitrosoglobus terrae]BAW79482.1 preprotein translocase subunit SecF [Candidatus Nitrosoglobus terrae]